MHNINTMSIDCGVKPYIKKLTNNEQLQEALNNKHNAIFKELHDSKAFKLYEGVLYEKPSTANAGRTLIGQINAHYGVPVTKIQTPVSGKPYVFVNVRNLVQSTWDEMNKPKDFPKQGELNFLGLANINNDENQKNNNPKRDFQILSKLPFDLENDTYGITSSPDVGSNNRFGTYQKISKSHTLSGSEFFKRSLSDIFSDSSITEQEKVLATYNSFQRSYEENPFYYRLGERLGVQGIKLILSEDAPPAFYDIKTDYVCLNFFENKSILKNLEYAAKNGDIDKYVNKAMFEELIHGVAMKLITKDELTRILEEEFSDENFRTKILSYYSSSENVNIQDFEAFFAFHEYLRMNIQNKFEGETTEQIAHSKNFTLYMLLNRVWKWLQEKFSDLPLTQIAQNKVFDYINNSQTMNSFKELQATKASPETIKKVREFLSRTGVKEELLTGKGKNLQGVASFLEGVVKIAEGKTDVALTEEAMHFGLEMLKQLSPSLYKQMFNKIGQYVIYDKVLKVYGKDNNYRNEDGSLNITKLKDEAITKLIVEWVHKNDNNEETQVDEYMKPSKQNEQIPFVLNWWRKIIAFFKSKFNIAGFNPFEEASKKLMADDFKGTFINSTDEMLSLSPNIVGNEMENIIKQQQIDWKLTKIIQGDENYYEITNPTTGEVKKLEGIDRTTEWAKSQVAKKYPYAKDYLLNRTEEEKLSDTEKANIGTRGHSDAENIIKFSLNEDGTLKPRNEVVINFVPESKQEMEPETGEYYNPVFNSLKHFLIGTSTKLGWLYTFPAGTKFLIEQQLYNPKVGKNGRAGTSDLIAIIPLENGKYDVKIFDWKFMGINTQKGSNDQTIFKREQHGLQMSDYKNAIKEYVSKLSDPSLVSSVTANTIPFRINYGIRRKTGLPFVKGVESGNVDISKEEKTYLLPVTAQNESTGNSAVDEQIRLLHIWYDRLYNTVVSSEDERHNKKEKLNKLSEAIRHLQIRMNFDRLSVEADNFKSDLQSIIDKYTNVDLSKFSINDLNVQLGDLDVALKSLNTFSNIDEVFISVYGDSELDEKSEATLTTFKTIARDVETKNKAILDIMRKYVSHIAQERNISNVLSNEREVKGFISELTELGDISLPMAKLLNQMNLVRTSVDSINAKNKIQQFNDLYIKAHKAVGNKLWELIATPDVQLSDKIKKEFFNNVKKAKEEEDKKWLLDNINKDVYKTLLEEKIKSETERIQSQKEHIDSKKSEQIIKKKIVEMKQSLDMNRKDFNGYYNPKFTSLLYKCLKYEDNYTDSYKNMNEDVKNLYDFIYDLNEQAYQTDYLSKGWRTFLPFIEDTLINRIFKNKNSLKQSWDLIKESYQVVYNDEHNFGGKRNKETGELELSIPKRFTRGKEDKSIYSKDLLKIIPLYINAIEDRNSAVMYENIFNALYIVEKNKNHLEQDNGKIKMTGDVAEVFTGNNVNSQIIRNAINDYIYGIKTIGDQLDPIILKAVENVAKGSKEEKEEKAINVKKGVETLMKFQQLGALGLKFAVALPNFMGNQFQSYINAGNKYKFREYLKNENKLTFSVLSDEQKGLLDLIVPLNDDIAIKERRKTAWKQSSIKWLQTWSVQDVLMSYMHIPDKLVQMANALSWIDNTMVVNGELVNIREWVRKQDQIKYNRGNVKETENTFENRVKELKETKSLDKVVEFDSDGYLTIPGVSIEEIAKYRAKIIENGRRITGQMNEDNKAGYRRQLLWKSFFMFKNWIPKQVSVRGKDLAYDPIQETWDYGRTRLFAKTWAHLGITNISSAMKMIKIMQGTKEGIQYMKEMLEEKKKDYKEKTGRDLEITDEDFYDLVRQQLKNTCKEIALLLGLIAIILMAKAAAPDDDDRRKKNRYNYLARLLNKTSDEVLFYYDPTSFQSITTGSLIPGVQVLGTAMNAFKHTYTEITGDEKKEKQNKVVKYWINLVPGANSIVSEILPLTDAELATEMGYRTTTQSRPQR